MGPAGRCARTGGVVLTPKRIAQRLYRLRTAADLSMTPTPPQPAHTLPTRPLLRQPLSVEHATTPPPLPRAR
jgi:hypothetical protein